MNRVLAFTFAIIAYLVGMGGLTWFIIFIGPWPLSTFHIDAPATMSVMPAIALNFTLITIFAVQHSLMARPFFKKKLSKLIPYIAERSCYVFISGVLLALFCLYWQPIDALIWKVEHSVLTGLLIIMFLLGWLLVVISTFLINHFELFGLQRAYYHLRQQPEPKIVFYESTLYKFVRHPMQLGVIIGLWAVPTMSVSHFMLALLMTVYIFIGLYFEEKDLLKTLGKEYGDYQQRVPMIIPFLPMKNQNKNS